MVEQNVPQAQAGESGIQQPPYGFGGSPSAYQPIGGYQSFQQPLTQGPAMQQNPAQQNPAQQNPAQPQQNPGQQNLAQPTGQQNLTQPNPPQQGQLQQNPAQLQQNPGQQNFAQQQNPGQQNSGQQGQIHQNPAQQQTPVQSPAQQDLTQNPMQQIPGQQGASQHPLTQGTPQGAGQQPQSGGVQQRTQQPQAGGTQSWYQSTLAGTPPSQGSAQPTGQGVSAQFGAASSAQPSQSQQLQGAGQPPFGTPTSAGPYGSQSAMMQSPATSTIQGPSIQAPVSEFSASDTAATQFQAASSPTGSQQQPSVVQQAPTGGSAYEQSVPQELRAAVGGLDQLANVAEWAETRFAQQGNGDASRACEDVHDRAHTATDFILRGSPFAVSAARELQATIGGAMQELQRHQTPEAQEVLNRAQQANQLLEAAISRLDPAGSATQ